MSDLDDFELSRAPQEGRGPGRGRFPGGLVTAAILMVVGVTWLGYLAFRPTAPLPTPAPAAPAPTVATATPSPTPEPPIELPPLEQSDAFVRDLARELSSHPQLALWLKAPNLVRTFTVVVVNIANGETPRPHLGFLAPEQGLRVLDRRGRLLIDPASYQGYAAFADAAASLDAAACARAFRVVEPLVDAAHRELGHPPGSFRRTLERALTALLETPVLEGDVPVVRVVRAVVVYELADRRLEETLTPAQKQLLRTGPRTVRIVQAKSRELAEALGLRVAPARPRP